MQKRSEKKGIALLTAVLIMSLILAVGLSLMTFVVKQFNIATSARESVISIYAADAGIECALLWDIQSYTRYGGPVFATSTGAERAIVGGIGSGPAECFTADLPSIWSVTEGATSATTTFELDFTGAPVYCTSVTVVKRDTGARIETSIQSRGYNVPCSDYTTNQNAVERAIKVDYIFI